MSLYCVPSALVAYTFFIVNKRADDSITDLASSPQRPASAGQGAGMAQSFRRQGSQHHALQWTLYNFLEGQA